jgi:hypothetical protein
MHIISHLAEHAFECTYCLDCNHAAALLKYSVWLASAHYCAAYQTDGIIHCAAHIGTHKTKLTHLMRATAAKIMAERATPFDIIKIMGRWEWSVPTLAYIAKKKNSLPPVNWRWVGEGDGYVGRLQPHGQPLGVGLPSGLQCLVTYPYRIAKNPAAALPVSIGAEPSVLF